MHYDEQREEELETKYEMKNIDMSNYTDEQWFISIREYLIEVMGMNNEQVKAEFDKRFPDLLVRDLF